MRTYWGGIYNRELKGLMLKHAFKYVDKVLFEVGESNLRSRKAMEKVGGKLIGNAQLDGNGHVIYEINKEDWSQAAG